MASPKKYTVVNKVNICRVITIIRKGKVFFTVQKKKAQQLINKYAGTGTWIGKNKERVDFGKVIGSYIDATGKIIKTTVGIIHYSKTGAHIVPAAPIK